ncbi:3-dehydroquinate synthase II (plasmid) [Haloferax sp. S1W]|uniref:3-dehydroquinate synthase II n=1 Tax=Haloferax sp. S1W TaxID=3377110 RepID=UPI0037CACBEF
MPAKQCWLDSTVVDETSQFELYEAFNLSFDAIVLSVDKVDTYEFPASTSRAVPYDPDRPACLDSADIAIVSDKGHVSKALKHNCSVAYQLDLDTVLNEPPNTLVEQLPDQAQYLVVPDISEVNRFDSLLETVRDAGLPVISGVRSPGEAESVVSTMNGTSGGVMISSPEPEKLSKYVKVTQGRSDIDIPLEPFEIETIKQIGTGIRCCLDTTTLMGEMEGMLVGSTNAGGLFVNAEARAPPEASPRPFRVNAGSVHSYVWTDEEDWDYLTSLGMGDTVACLNVDGSFREVNVGRVLLAERPLTQIIAKGDTQTVSTIVQDHCHVRFMRQNGEAVSVPNLEEGDHVLGHATNEPQPVLDRPTAGVERRDIDEPNDHEITT